MTKLLNAFALLFLFTSCIKTAEQVQREKKIDSISNQMSDSQNLLADMMTELKSMQSQLDKMNGRLEELEHRQKQVSPEGLKSMNESLNVLKAQQETDTAQMTQIQAELKEQRAFLEKVTTTLSGLSASQASKDRPAGKKKSVKEELTSALDLVRNNKYDEARSELESLIGHKELSPGDTNKLMHGLGRVEYYSKNYDKALVYFSKIYTKYPKSSLAASSLLFIGKTLEKMSKNNEAKEAFAKVVEDYPASKEAKEAKKEL